MAAYVRIVNTASGGTAVQLVHDHRADARTGSKPPIVAGLLAASDAMVWLAQLGAHAGYAGACSAR